MVKRRRFKHQVTLQDRVIAWAKEVRDQAAALPPGRDRDTLLKKVRQAETALHLENLTSSSRSQPDPLKPETTHAWLRANLAKRFRASA
jgi:hypothetical protein